MNGEDRKRLDGLEEEVRDIRIIQNELFGDVDEIKNNHLVHIKNEIQFIKGSQGVILKTIGWGLAGLAVLTALVAFCH